MVKVKTTLGIETIENYVSMHSSETFLIIVIDDDMTVNYNMKNLISFAVINDESDE